jgi:hypothetical protein
MQEENAKKAKASNEKPKAEEAMKVGITNLKYTNWFHWRGNPV